MRDSLIPLLQAEQAKRKHDTWARGCEGCKHTTLLCSTCLRKRRENVTKMELAFLPQSLEQALSKLDDVQLCDNTWQQAESAKREIIAIIQEFGGQAARLIEEEKQIAEDLRAEIAGLNWELEP